MTKKISSSISIPVRKIEIVKPTPIELPQIQDEEEELITNEQAKQMLAEAEKECELLIKEAKQTSELLMNEAKEQREKMFNEAKIEIEKLKQEAYDDAQEKGYHHGFEQGEAKAKEECTTQSEVYLEELKKSCSQIKEETRTYMDEIRPELVQLIKRIVEKVTQQVMEDSETKLVPLLTTQLKELSRRKQLFIRVHPDSYEHLEEHEAQLQKFCVDAKVHLISDITLSEYGCVIESESEIIDLQIDKQLTQLFKELERVVKEQ